MKPTPRVAFRSRPVETRPYAQRPLRHKVTKCLHCGQTFAYETRNSGKARRKFCSRQCLLLSRPRHERACAVCGKVFRYYPSEDKGSIRTYCSMECYGAAIRLALGNPKVRCQQEHLKRLPPKAARKSWLLKGVASWSRQHRVRTLCGHCRSVFYPQRHKARKFCSTRCYFHARHLGVASNIVPQECLLHCRYSRGNPRSDNEGLPQTLKNRRLNCEADRISRNHRVWNKSFEGGPTLV